MNRVICVVLLIVAVTAALLGSALYLRVAVLRGHQQAIVKVLAQEHECETQKRIFKNGRIEVVHLNQKDFSQRNYLVSLERIPTDGCPQKFRISWLDFVQTVKRNEMPFAGLGSTVEYGISAYKKYPEGTKDALARLDRLNLPEAQMRLERVALEYGVQILHN